MYQVHPAPLANGDAIAKYSVADSIGKKGMPVSKRNSMRMTKENQVSQRNLVLHAMWRIPGPTPGAGPPWLPPDYLLAVAPPNLSAASWARRA